MPSDRVGGRLRSQVDRVSGIDTGFLQDKIMYYSKLEHLLRAVYEEIRTPDLVSSSRRGTDGLLHTQRYRLGVPVGHAERDWVTFVAWLSSQTSIGLILLWCSLQLLEERCKGLILLSLRITLLLGPNHI